MNVVKGSVVRSLAGRDRGGYFVAVDVTDRFVTIADGKERKLSSPKRKNVRHISPTSHVIELSGMTDKKLKRLLRELEPEANGEPLRPDENKK
ncbi:MAG: KOW domain-containing RNA-binding protein [Ruminococcus sp.]|nr:KOW domain-containing RNA-binding protein [Ruminococcus sp.]